MGRTRHMQARMSQRAIGGELVELTCQFGEPFGDGKFVLNRKACRALIDRSRGITRAAERALNKGGLVVVREGERFITTYALDSFSMKKARGAA